MNYVSSGHRPSNRHGGHRTAGFHRSGCLLRPLLVGVCLFMLRESRAAEAQEKSALYLNPDAPVNERVDDLMSRLTFRQKMGLRDSTSTTKARRRGLGWSETVHGLGRHGMATVFPQAIGLAATFDVDLMEKIGAAISDEVRAKYHMGDKPGMRRGAGLLCGAPVVNIVRDPRWGRAQETYGEDPVLSGLMGQAYTRGMLGADPRYPKVLICVKHYAVHSGPEATRKTFNAVVGLKDLHETYLPAFKMVIDAGADCVMASYNLINGLHACLNPYLLKEVLRDQWAFGGYVIPDGGGINALWEADTVAEDRAEAVGMAMHAGVDDPHAREDIAEAYKRGIISEKDIETGYRNRLRSQFLLGLFDPPGSSPYAQTPLSVVGCDKHVALAREAAVRSCVLLKNNGVLPLDPKTHSIHLVGPSAADIYVLLGNYNGINGRLTTIAEGVVERAGPTRMVNYAMGVPGDRPRAGKYDFVSGHAGRYDVTVAVMGFNSMVEGEEFDPILSDHVGDRMEIELPPWQKEFVDSLRASSRGHPLVLIVTGGSAVAIPELHELADAVVYAWYPGQEGGTAVADILFGDANPSGRLPITVPRSTKDLPDFEDYSMVGRTYRYATKPPLYPFGFGLGYSSFAYSKLVLGSRKVKAGSPVKVTATVKNTGKREGEEVVQLYLSDLETSVRAPRFELKGFKRVVLKPGRSSEVSFTVTPQMMELVDEKGKRAVERGKFRVYVGGACPDERSVVLGAPKPVTAEFTVR